MWAAQDPLVWSRLLCEYLLRALWHFLAHRGREVGPAAAGPQVALGSIVSLGAAQGRVSAWGLRNAR